MTKLFLLFTFFIATATHALDYREELKATVTKLFPPDQRFIINRGFEDGVLPRDISRFYQNDKAIFKAQVIASSKNQSEWMVYYTYEPYKLALNSDIIAKSLNNYHQNSELELPGEDFSRLKKIKDVEFARRKQEEAKKEQEKLAKEREERMRSSVQRIEVPHFHFEASFAPIIYSSMSGQENFNISLLMRNTPESEAISNSGFEIKYNDRRQEMFDPYKGTRIKNSERNLSHQWHSRDYWGDRLDYVTWSSYRQHQIGQYYPVKDEIRVGPIGVRKKANLDRRSTLTSILVPQYESIRAESLNRSSIVRHEVRSLRTSFSVTLDYKFTDTLTGSEGLTLRPAYNIDKSNFDFKDSDLLNVLKLSYAPTKNFQVSYANEYINDQRRANLAELPVSEKRHVISLDFAADFLGF